VAAEGPPGRGGVVTEGGVGAARPSERESRAAWGAAAARGGRGACGAFADRIHRAVGGETEQSREGMWPQPVRAVGGCFSSSFAPALLGAWLVGWLLALVAAGPPSRVPAGLGDSEGVI